MPKTVIVVPCYNEEARLQGEAFLAFLGRPGVGLLFVNDGSTDGTLSLLRGLCDALGDRAAVLDLERNGGKAEAVRQGMLRALAEGADVVAYTDADLATPAAELLRLLDVLDGSGRQVALGARVRLLGTAIRRKAVRHYLGRVFATCASLCLGIPVYDTQCGAKAFRRGPALQAALATPFASRWAFDVELIGRLLAGAPGAPGLGLDAFVEMPLLRWEDVAGSKVRLKDFPRMGTDLVRIWLNLRLRRRQLAAAAPGWQPTPARAL
jgi:glycosyltransferase involved in cell wall biosynthesis